MSDDAAIGAPDRHHHCFDIAARLPPLPCTVALDAGSALALADLLPLLGCGEEAAVLGFDKLAAQSGVATVSRTVLRDIAADERMHDALLGGLRAALPQPASAPAMRRAARRFHCGLTKGDAATHLTRIAGIDAAVCTIISRLLRPGAPLAQDPGVRSVLSHIRRDETRHVAASRNIAVAALAGRFARDTAAEARGGLADLLTFGAAAFDRLGVDPDRLLGDVRHLPNGLLPG